MSKRTEKREASRKLKKEVDAKSEWAQADIELDLEWEDINNKPKKETIKFSIIHDLPDIVGMRIEDAVENWKVRTETHTSRSLCDYINSKTHMTGNKAYTMEEYKEMSGGDDPIYLDPK